MIMLFKILFSLVMIKLLCLGEAEAKVRHSGRLLARPNPVKCSRRPRHLQEKSTGHNYFISEASNFKVSRLLLYTQFLKTPHTTYLKTLLKMHQILESYTYLLIAV